MTTPDLALWARLNKAKQAVGIVALYERLTGQSVPPTRQVRCPVHSDRTPSARIYEDKAKPHLHCFTCGESWDIFDLVAKVKGIPLADALGWIEAEFGLGSTVTARDEVRATLLRHAILDLTPMQDAAETLLRQTRTVVSLQQFGKWAVALDAIVYEHGRGAMTDADATTHLRDLYQVMQAHVRRPPDPHHRAES